MAITTAGGANNYLIRSTMGLTSANSYSVCFWFFDSETEGGGYSNHVCQQDGCGMGLQNNSGWKLNLGAPANDYNGSAISASTWYHVGWVRNGSSHTIYLNGVSDITASDAGSDTAWQLCNYAASPNASMNLAGSLAALKIWDNVQLTQAEILQEMRTIRPVRLRDLFLWCPWFNVGGSTLKDFSGNGRDWTVGGGSVSLGDNPPLGYGASPLSALPVAGAPPPPIYLPGYHV